MLEVAILTVQLAINANNVNCHLCNAMSTFGIVQRSVSSLTLVLSTSLVAICMMGARVCIAQELLCVTGSVEAASSNISPGDKSVFRDALLAAQMHGLEHEVLSPAEANARFPGYHLPPDYKARPCYGTTKSAVVVGSLLAAVLSAFDLRLPSLSLPHSRLLCHLLWRLCRCCISRRGACWSASAASRRMWPLPHGTGPRSTQARWCSPGMRRHPRMDDPISLW